MFHYFHLLFTFANWMLSWITIQRKSKYTILFAFTNTSRVHRICHLIKLSSFDQIHVEIHVVFNDINIIRGQMHVHWYYTRTKYWAQLYQWYKFLFASYFNNERNKLRLFLLISILQQKTTLISMDPIPPSYQCYSGN